MKTIYHLLYIIKLCFVILTLISTLSCESFTTIDEPDSQLNSSVVFQDEKTATAAMANIYLSKAILSGDQNGIGSILGLLTDELNCNTQNESFLNFYTPNIISSNKDILQLWNTTYNAIYQCNAVIEGLDKSITLNEQFKDQLKGEALFMRSLYLFYLSELFGDIPYVTTTNYTQNKQVKRLNKSGVYDLLIHDLQKAEELLSINYSSSLRIKPNKYTAQALLARIFLYQQNWSKAIEYSTKLIDDSSFEIQTDLNQVFLKENKSTIWQYQSADKSNTQEGSYYIFSSAPPNLISLSNSLYESFESSDQRKSHWIKSIDQGNKAWHHVYKYKQNGQTDSSKEFSIVFRLEEMYLIRSEAYARLQVYDLSCNDLNTIRNRAGLPSIQINNQTELLKAILQERQHELFLEHGHRFFDLRRFSELGNTMLSIKNNWNTKYNLLPIPENEILLNPNLLPQNINY